MSHCSVSSVIKLMIMYDDEDEEAGFLLCIKIPDLQSQTRIVVKQSDSVFTSKQSVLSKLQVSQ